MTENQMYRRLHMNGNDQITTVNSLEPKLAESVEQPVMHRIDDFRHSCWKTVRNNCGCVVQLQLMGELGS
jgi:hypothetical protein